MVDVAELRRLMLQRDDMEQAMRDREAAGDAVHFFASECFESARDQLSAALFEAAPALLDELELLRALLGEAVRLERESYIGALNGGGNLSENDLGVVWFKKARAALAGQAREVR